MVALQPPFSDVEVQQEPECGQQSQGPPAQAGSNPLKMMSSQEGKLSPVGEELAHSESIGSKAPSEGLSHAGSSVQVDLQAQTAASTPGEAACNTADSANIQRLGEDVGEESSGIPSFPISATDGPIYAPPDATGTEGDAEEKTELVKLNVQDALHKEEKEKVDGQAQTRATAEPTKSSDRGSAERAASGKCRTSFERDSTPPLTADSVVRDLTEYRHVRISKGTSTTNRISGTRRKEDEHRSQPNKIYPQSNHAVALTQAEARLQEPDAPGERL